MLAPGRRGYRAQKIAPCTLSVTASPCQHNRGMIAPGDHIRFEFAAQAPLPKGEPCGAVGFPIAHGAWKICPVFFPEKAKMAEIMG